MKKNKLFSIKIFIWILFFPFITSILSIGGLYLGDVIVFFKTGVFSLESSPAKLLNTIKVGVIIGLLLGISLWVWGIVIPELTGKFKIDNKDIDDTKNQK